MNPPKKPWWQNYVPVYAKNPFKFVWQLLTNKKPSARSALYMAAAGLALSPLDIAFVRKERQIYEKAPEPNYPIVLVCGPPRSGTTLVAQYLINNLDVGYVNNLTSLFPRSPIYANDVFGRWLHNTAGDYDAFYGKSRGLDGPNDALYIWDRWLGGNRETITKELIPGTERDLQNFFGALQQRQERPTVNKVNRLVTCAHLVVKALPKAQFLCLRRDPVMLAQSLLIARREIGGDAFIPYGVHHPDRVADDPLEDVCRQVLFYERIIQEQKERLHDQFSIIEYEQFCKNPSKTLELIDILCGPVTRRNKKYIYDEQFTISRAQRLTNEEFETITERLRKPIG